MASVSKNTTSDDDIVKDNINPNYISDIVEDINNPTLEKILDEQKYLIDDANRLEEQGIENTKNENNLAKNDEDAAKEITRALNKNTDFKKQIEKYIKDTFSIKYNNNIQNVFDFINKIDDAELNKYPRFVKKRLRKILPLVISDLKNPDAINALSSLLTKIEINLVNTKPKFFQNMKDKYNTYKEKMNSFKLFQKKEGGQQLNKTKKYKGGDRGYLYGMLITCCLTGIGCPICGPILIILLIIEAYNAFGKNTEENQKGGKQKNKTKQMKRNKKTKRNNK